VAAVVPPENRDMKPKYSVKPKARFIHPAQVQVLRLPADAGVLDKYAESAELNRSDREI
jgi:hypothetical protein